MKSLTFVTGIYGVGKSTLCRQLASETSVQYLKASTLIFDQLNQAQPSNKRVSSVSHLDSNQQALIVALSTIKSTEDILLEGHSCLLDQNNIVHRIPLDVFRAINVTRIILVTRSVAPVQLGLINRDNTKYDIAALEQLQENELNYALQISKKLSIPYLHVNLDHTSTDTALSAIKNFLSLTGCSSQQLSV